VDVEQTEVQTSRVLTIPNLLSMLRLLGVPLFLWLVLVQEADGWAVVVLAISGFTDYLDGKLARRWNQVSRLGQLLDPLADRLYVLTTVAALTIREIIPIWFAALLIGRDVLFLFFIPFLRRLKMKALPVHFLGKAGTFCLLYALPLLLLGDGDSTLALLARVFGWSFGIWGVVLYWWAGFLYVVQLRRLFRSRAVTGE
jgi:cardiolipin synthase (CMP-forming)